MDIKIPKKAQREMEDALSDPCTTKSAKENLDDLFKELGEASVPDLVNNLLKPQET